MFILSQLTKVTNISGDPKLKNNVRQ